MNTKKTNLESEKPTLNKGAAIGNAFRSTLIELGFKEIPHSTITASLTYDLGRNRQLSFGSIQTPNEMLFIYEVDEKDSRKINDLVCLRNYDYDGYTNIEQIKELIKFLTGRIFQHFKAVAPNGDTVTGCVTSGWFKGNTVRTND